jgi:uncharacterized protein YcbK (DUF882 family)
MKVISYTPYWENVEHFSPEEFDSPDKEGSGRMMNIYLIFLLEEIRKRINLPIKITSGYRTIEHNRKVNGDFDSSHLKGLAADIYCENNVYRYLILQYALLLRVKRIGIYKKHIHIDIDKSKQQFVFWVKPYQK